MIINSNFHKYLTRTAVNLIFEVKVFNISKDVVSVLSWSLSLSPSFSSLSFNLDVRG